MERSQLPAAPAPGAPAPGRLGSWKEIASYLGTTVRTAQRWEKTEQLPVRRHLHAERHSVYAFVSELEQWRAARGEDADRWRRGIRRVWVVPLLLTALAAAGMALWAALSTPAVPAFVTPLPLTSYPGHEVYPDLSPDGRQVAFSWDGEPPGRFAIYTQALGASIAPARLTSDFGNELGPVWSPDGRTLAFIRRRASNRGHVVLVAPSGGAPEKKLAEVAFRRPGFWGSGGAGRLLAWTPDGRWLAVSTMDSPADPLRLVLVSADTGDIKDLTGPPRGLTGDVAAAFSPDGRTLVFSRFIDDQQGDLYLLRLSREYRALGSPRRLTFGNELTLSPVWSADGRHVIFTAGTTARTLRLWTTAVTGGKPQPIDLGYTPVDSVARRGKRLVFTRPTGDISLWVQQLPGDGQERPVADPPTSLISSSWPDAFAQFSPDGRRIAFGSIRSGSREIYLSNRDGSNVVQLTSFRGPSVVHPRWSPDGTRLAFTVTMNGSTEIHTIVSTGGRSRSIYRDRALVSETSSDVLNWSRDGRWIYFISRRSGEPQTWKVPAAGGTAIQVTRGGGFAAVESPDGRHVYFLKRPPLTLWQVPIDGGDERHVRDLRGGGNLTPSGVYFVKRAVPPHLATLMLLSFDTMAERVVAEVEDPGAEFTVSPDARLLLYAQRESRATDLMLVDDFDVR